MKITRRMTLTALTNGGFRVETEYQTRTGDWSTLGTSITVDFPWFILRRVVDRGDYQIKVRAQ